MSTGWNAREIEIRCSGFHHPGEEKPWHSQKMIYLQASSVNYHLSSVGYNLK
jgi:hypothetical protein